MGPIELARAEFFSWSVVNVVTDTTFQNLLKSTGYVYVHRIDDP